MNEKIDLKPLISSREIGERIRRRRRGLHISQEQLAEMLDVSFQQVQRYECGINRLNVEKIQVIARLLSIPVAELLDAQTDQEVPVLQDAHATWIAADEQELVRRFRQITKKDRNTILEVVRLATRKTD
jgi:transcriptional regulator with XRE-family HTH domain